MNKNKRAKISLLVVFSVFFATLTAFSVKANATASLYSQTIQNVLVNYVNVLINGQILFSADAEENAGIGETETLTVNDTVYINVNTLAKFLNASQTWDGETKTLLLSTAGPNNFGYTGLSDDNILKQVDDDYIYSSNNSGKTILYIGRTDCPACQSFIPKLDKLARENGFKEIAFLPASELSSQTISSFGLEYVPTTIFFADGKEVDRIVGDMEEDELNAMLSSFFGFNTTD